MIAPNSPNFNDPAHWEAVRAQVAEHLAPFVDILVDDATLLENNRITYRLWGIVLHLLAAEHARAWTPARAPSTSQKASTSRPRKPRIRDADRYGDGMYYI